MLWEVISPSVISTWPPLSCFTSASDQVHHIQSLLQNPLELQAARGSRAGSQTGRFFILQQLFQGQTCAGASGSGRCFLSQRRSENQRLWAGSKASRAPRGCVWMIFYTLMTQIRAGGCGDAWQESSLARFMV